MNNDFASQVTERNFTFGTSTGHELPDSFAKHYHSWYEIYRLTAGTCRYFIDDTVHDLIPGDIMVIPPYLTHKNFYKSIPYTRSVLYITESYVPSFINELIEKKGLVYRLPEFYNETSEIFDRINQEYLNWDQYSDQIMNSYVQILAGLLLRNQNHYTNENVSSNTHIDGILKYIQKNFSSAITLNQTAAVFSISPEYLARLFKQQTGMTFNTYLTNLRFKEAEILLKKRCMTVSEIAFACGFNDSNYFSTKFRKIYGMTPVSFRNQFKSPTEDEQAENASDS